MSQRPYRIEPRTDTISEARRQPRGAATVAFLLGFVTASLAAALAWSWWAFAWSAATGSRIDLSRPAVVSQIQRLQRLETVVFGMDKIVSGERENRFLPRFFAGDRLLLVVFGEVSAGVDLGRIQPDDVAVDDASIRLDMPEPEIFTTRLDNERTRVYSRDTGLFSRVDPQLESEVRLEAERQVRQAALDSGILDAAAANARATLTSFLEGLGFEQVVVD